jgi:uncharacterized membrane protein
MTTTSKDWELPGRLGVWCALQAIFFFWVYPNLGRWMRRETNVYFCLAAFALALVSMVVVVPVSSRVSVLAKSGFLLMLSLGCWEVVRAMRVFLWQC